VSDVMWSLLTKAVQLVGYAWFLAVYCEPQK
jgi:hypothetical protein